MIYLTLSHIMEVLNKFYGSQVCQLATFAEYILFQLFPMLSLGTCLGGFVTEFGVTACTLSSDGDHIVIALPGCDHLVTLQSLLVENAIDVIASRGEVVYGDAANIGQQYTVSK